LIFSIAFGPKPVTLTGSIIQIENKTLNPELCKKALEKVGNPNILINLISRRVRQLNSGGGSASRPLIADVTNMAAADIALLEIVENRMSWEVPEPAVNERPSNNKKRKKH
jgi:DNA-directed RNA polymerase subunit omega